MAVPTAMQPTTTVKQPMMMVPVNTTRIWTALVSSGEIACEAVWMIQRVIIMHPLLLVVVIVHILLKQLIVMVRVLMVMWKIVLVIVEVI